MKVGVIGCGYVFDHYMSTINRHPVIQIAGVADRDSGRAIRVGKFYQLPVREMSELLADPEIETIANFTSIESHYEVSKAALEAGKHVYSEKPLAMRMDEARSLVKIADRNCLRLSCAPSNALSPTAQTLWKIVDDGAIGEVRMVYAEFDDNPVYLLRPETWRSRSGAPWPYLHEYEMGCTWEHVGYHLTWMCAIFGPVRSVTSFSKRTLPDKTEKPLDPPDTPDFSVACLDFESGVVGRVTCSIAAPTDHRMRIFGNRGMVEADTYRHYEAPVFLEFFSDWSLKAHNMASVRRHSFLRWPFGVGGRRVPLAKSAAPGAERIVDPLVGGWGPRAFVNRIKQSQFGLQDKCLGIAELVDAISTGREHFPSHDFILHQTELTHAIQAAGPNGTSHILSTTFAPLSLPERTRRIGIDYKCWAKPAPIPRLIGRLLGARKGRGH